MLARMNRLVTADDYRRLVRRGRRHSTPHLVVYSAHTRDAREARFGFIVSKGVGIAVQRNLLRRRLKSLCHAELPSISAGTEIVIRALPGAAQVTWDTLRKEISEALDRGVEQV